LGFLVDPMFFKLTKEDYTTILEIDLLSETITQVKQDLGSLIEDSVYSTIETFTIALSTDNTEIEKEPDSLDISITVLSETIH
jgi:hypothetical protein